MLRDRYTPVELFALIPVLALRFEPALAEVDRLREDDQLFQQVKADLSRRGPRTLEKHLAGPPGQGAIVRSGT